MSNINEAFKNRLNELNNNSGLKPPTQIDSDSFRKYLKGQRFPNNENLEIIKEHYHVSYDYLFGEYDNTNLDTKDISLDLGLDEDVIEKLKNIVKFDTQFKRDTKKYAINTFLRNLDFEKLGLLLSFPSYRNKNINSNDYYNLYSKYFEIGINSQLQSEVQNNDELNNYKIYKQVSELCEKARRSKKCIEKFKKIIDEKNKIDNKYFENLAQNYYNDDLSDLDENNNEENIFEIEKNDIIAKRIDDVKI